MPTERSRKFTAWFGEHKEELIDKIKNNGVQFPENASEPWIRVLRGDGLLYYGGLGEVWKHFSKEKGLSRLDRRERAAFAKELTSGLRKRHTFEIFSNRLQNFLAGLGYYRDIYYLHHFPNTTFLINIIALTLSVAGIALVARIRWPVAIMGIIHIMALLAAVFGHFVLGRYVEPTEPLLLLAGMCSLWALCGHKIARNKMHGAIS